MWFEWCNCIVYSGIKEIKCSQIKAGLALANVAPFAGVAPPTHSQFTCKLKKETE